MKRFAAALVALLAVVGSSDAAPREGWHTFRDPYFDWRLTYPERFQLEHFEGFNRISWYGVSLSNFGQRRSVRWPGVAPEIPQDGVVIRFWYQAGGPSPSPESRDDRLPLSFSRFARYQDGPRPHPKVLSFQFGGSEFTAVAWIGAQAPRRDVVALRRIVSLFRPAPLRAGGVTNPCEYYVLERAASYALPSVREYNVDDLPDTDCLSHRPFYLVRLRGAFLALAARYKNCRISFDAARSEFFCRSSGARWNRAGLILAGPTEATDPLTRHHVIRGYDGRILVSTNLSTWPHPPRARRP